MGDMMHDSDDEIIEDQAAEIVKLRVALVALADYGRLPHQRGVIPRCVDGCVMCLVDSIRADTAAVDDG